VSARAADAGRRGGDRGAAAWVLRAAGGAGAASGGRSRETEKKEETEKEGFSRPF
jgi:hypothetical protein